MERLPPCRLHQASGGARGGRKYRLAHVSPHLLNAGSRSRRDAGCSEGTTTPRQHSDHDECLHSSNIQREAGSSIEGRQCAIENVSVVRSGTRWKVSFGCKLLTAMVGGIGLERMTFCL